MTLHLDYETRSEVNLLTEGAYKYATHPSTKVLFVGYAEDDDPVQLWKPGDEVPGIIWEYFDAGRERSIHAHNAQFERLISWYVFCPDYDVPEPPLEAFYCTASQARARALPGSLDKLGRALGLPVTKNRRGTTLIKALCIPQPDGSFNNDPVLMREFGEYCRTDVGVERAAASASHELTDPEWQDFLVNERINDRGLGVDMELAAAAVRYAAEEAAEISGLLSDLTGGVITTPKQYARVKKWLLERAPDLEDEMARYVKGEKKLSFDRSVRENILDDEDRWPEEVLDLTDLVDEAGRSSIAKFQAMLLRGPRVQGAYLFSGAGQTGRYSSKGLQVHNFPRKTPKDVEAVRQDILDHDIGDNVIDVLSTMLRPAIVAPPGKTFVCGDWSAIEARVLPWLSNTNGGRRKLDIFKACDADPELPDVYERQAAAMGVEDRQLGKVGDLSMGFQGGQKAFRAMARNYGLIVTTEEAERYKHAWRDANQWCVAFWRHLDDAVRIAVGAPGVWIEVGRVAYMMGERDLWCRLPSGRVLTYPFTRLELIDGKFGPQYTVTCLKASRNMKQDAEEWPRIGLYGGMLAENITQAGAADVLRDTLHAIEPWDNCVGHTHDEALLEVPESEAAYWSKALQSTMLYENDWAEGLPLAVSMWTGPRYRK